MKNPHYENILEDQDFKKRCYQSDPEGFKVLFPDDGLGFENFDKASQGIDLSSLEINSQKESSQNPDNNSKRRRIRKWKQERN